MKPSQTFRFGAAAVVLTFALAGCVVHPSVPDSPSGSPSGSPTPGASSSPPIEPTTGTETPESHTGGAVAISLAPAPVGGNGTSGDNDECIRVSWLGNLIPRGDVITVTWVNVVPPFTFDTAVTAQCADAPSCLHYQFSAANDDNEHFCNVGLGYKYGSIDLQNGSEAHGTLQLTSSLSCPSNISSAACQHDKAAMQRPGIGTISFEVFTIDKTSTPSSPPGSPSSSESSSSPSVTPGSSPAVAPGSP